MTRGATTRTGARPVARADVANIAIPALQYIDHLTCLGSSVSWSTGFRVEGLVSGCGCKDNSL